MNEFILLIFLPAVTFLIMYLTGCVYDRRKPLKIKDNWINLTAGIGGASFMLVMGALIYIYNIKGG